MNAISLITKSDIDLRYHRLQYFRYQEFERYDTEKVDDSHDRNGVFDVTKQHAFCQFNLSTLGLMTNFLRQLSINTAGL